MEFLTSHLTSQGKSLCQEENDTVSVHVERVCECVYVCTCGQCGECVCACECARRECDCGKERESGSNTKVVQAINSTRRQQCEMKRDSFIDR